MEFTENWKSPFWHRRDEKRLMEQLDFDLAFSLQVEETNSSGILETRENIFRNDRFLMEKSEDDSNSLEFLQIDFAKALEIQEQEKIEEEDFQLALYLQEKLNSHQDPHFPQNLSSTFSSTRFHGPETEQFLVNDNLSHFEMNQPLGESYEELTELCDRIGRVSVGLSKSQIAKFSERKIQFGDNDNTKQCSICLSVYEIGDTMKTLPCHHQYHSRCINTWLQEKASCPTCLKELK